MLLTSKMLAHQCYGGFLCCCDMSLKSEMLDFAVGPVVRTLQGTWVPSLLGEVRCHLLCVTAKNFFKKEKKKAKHLIGGHTTVFGK